MEISESEQEFGPIGIASPTPDGNLRTVPRKRTGNEPESEGERALHCRQKLCPKNPIPRAFFAYAIPLPQGGRGI
jgi:hypothetical protein